MARSTAYWSANLYQDPGQEPKRSAPLRDLPPLAAARFRMVREGLLDLPRVTERVRYMSEPWHWAWEYGVQGRRLCWLHVMETGTGASFYVSDEEAPALLSGARLSAVMEQSIGQSQRVGPLRWCWIEFTERRVVEAFLTFMKRKASITLAAPDERIFRRHRAG